MSIWSSFCTFGYIGPSPEIRSRRSGELLAPAGTEPQLNDEPYLDAGPPDGQLLSDDMEPERAAKTPRGGFVGLASTWYEASLVRLQMADEHEREVEVYLHVDQLRRLRDAVSDFLERREQYLRGERH